MAINQPLSTGFQSAAGIPMFELNSNAVAQLDAVHAECYDGISNNTHTVSNDIGFNSVLSL